MRVFEVGVFEVRLFVSRTASSDTAATSPATVKPVTKDDSVGMPVTGSAPESRIAAATCAPTAIPITRVTTSRLVAMPVSPASTSVAAPASSAVVPTPAANAVSTFARTSCHSAVCSDARANSVAAATTLPTTTTTRGPNRRVAIPPTESASDPATAPGSRSSPMSVVSAPKPYPSPGIANICGTSSAVIPKPVATTRVSTHACHIAGRASMRRSTIGAAVRRSTTTHPVTRPATAMVRAMTARGDRPDPVTRTSPIMNVSSAPLSRRTPGQSIRPSARTGGSCGINRITASVATMTTTVGRANIQCQDSPSATGPANSVPTMPPPVKNARTTPIAACDRPAGRFLRATMKERGSAPTMTPWST